MAIYTIPTVQLEVLRDAIILDTNVLVHAFCEDEKHHDDAFYFVNEYSSVHQLIVPMEVVVETWGMIVGSKKQRRNAIEFLSWLLNPGSNVYLISGQSEQFSDVNNLIQSLHIDYVDAVVIRLAHEISEKCSMSPDIEIASYDTRDFYNKNFWK